MKTTITAELFKSMENSVKALTEGERPENATGAALFDAYNQGVNHALKLMASYGPEFLRIDELLDLAKS